MHSQSRREFSSAGSEHLPYKQRVGGSNPSTPTRYDERLDNIQSLFLFICVRKRVFFPSNKKIAVANATAINSFILRRLLLGLLCLLWELELGHTCTNEDIEPRESLLDIRNVNTLTIVLWQHLAEVSLHLIS